MVAFTVVYCSLIVYLLFTVDLGRARARRIGFLKLSSGAWEMRFIHLAGLRETELSDLCVSDFCFDFPTCVMKFIR